MYHEALIIFQRIILWVGSRNLMVLLAAHFNTGAAYDQADLMTVVYGSCLLVSEIPLLARRSQDMDCTFSLTSSSFVAICLCQFNASLDGLQDIDMVSCWYHILIED